MANEVIGDLGYLAFNKETTAGTAVTPNAYALLYEESLSTPINLNEIKPAVGNKFARFQTLQGQRSHGGEFTIQAEPNTTAQVFDMLLTRGTVTGSDPYTWPFTLGANSNSYTVDISNGNHVSRYIGVQASEIAALYQDNEMRWKVKVSALKAFHGAEIASVAGAVVTLKTDGYSTTPTDGLVAGDLVACWDATDLTKQNFTISSLTATNVTLSGSPTSIAAGDMLVLRPATPTFPTTPPFLWARSEWRYSATDAATALTATHTPVEQGSTFTIKHGFKDDAGEMRSGSFDPTSLARTTGDVEVSANVFFQHPDEAKAYLGIRKKALVIRCFSGTANAHEFRLTLNDLRIRSGGDKPMVKTGEVEYYELEYAASYDASDASAWDVKVINALAST